MMLLFDGRTLLSKFVNLVIYMLSFFYHMDLNFGAPLQNLQNLKIHLLGITKVKESFGTLLTSDMLRLESNSTVPGSF